MYEPDSDATLQGYIGAGGSEINITDATKIIGCWRALQNPEGEAREGATSKPLTRAIAFNNTIRNSKRLVEHWNGVVESAIAQMPEDTASLPILRAKRSMSTGSTTRSIEKTGLSG